MILKNWTSICENYNIWCKKKPNKPLLHINLRVDASEEKKMNEPEDLATAYVQSRTQRDERLGEKIYQQWAMDQLQVDYHMCNWHHRKIIWRGGELKKNNWENNGWMFTKFDKNYNPKSNKLNKPKTQETGTMQKQS